MTLMAPDSTPTNSDQTTPSLLDKVNPLKAYQQQKSDQALIQWGLEQFSWCKQNRARTEAQWYLNAAFYFGKQNVVGLASKATANGFQLRTPNAPPWRVRLVINKIRSIVRHEVARLTSQKPVFTVVPATTEDDDYSAARIAESIFRAVYSDKNVAREFRRAAWWSVITGVGYIKDYWDPKKLDKNSNQFGDFNIERINPFFVFVPDLESEDIEEQPYVIHASTKSVEYIKNQWGIDVTPDSKASTALLEASFLNLVGVQQQHQKNSVLCLEFWVKPGGHKEFPEGGLFTIVGDKLLRQADKYPYSHGEYPFSKIDYVQSGKYYAESTITDIIPLQREYNRTHSQIVEAKNIMAKPRLIAPRGSINPRQVTTEPGQTILYTPGFNPPSPLPMDSLPPYVMQELELLQSDIDDISAQHEISRGGTPPQVTAATAISYLQEQDDSKLSSTISSVEEAFQKIGRHILTYVADYWTTDRIVRCVGTDGTFEAARWKAEDIKGNTDLRVEAGSALPQSKAAKQAFIMDLIKMQLVPPQMALEMLDIGGIEKAYEDYLVDKRQAQRENLKLSGLADTPQALMPQPAIDPNTGQPVIDPNTGQPAMQPVGLLIKPNTYDNHAAHIQFHNQFRKSQQFEILPDEVKAQFEQHVMLHQYMSMSGATPIDANGNPLPPVGQPGTVDPSQQQGQQQGPPQQGPPQGPPQ